VILATGTVTLGDEMVDDGVAVVVGVGPGLGAALCRRFAKAGMRVAAAARDGERVSALAKAVGARGYGCDATEEAAVNGFFASVAHEIGEPTLVVYNAGAYAPKPVIDTTAAEFERCWRIGCFGGFLVGRAAARGMLARGHGTILFTGATASLRGGANFVNLAVGKFGLRALAQSMARELGPKGVHVAHVIIDGQIAAEHRPGRSPAVRAPDAFLHDDSIAEVYWQLHTQPRNAWTLELDVRPWVEKF
jgi:NAD(P)-dependent dehydrogenase (short-subunit alcohol dehydrogenase family)